MLRWGPVLLIAAVYTAFAGSGTVTIDASTGARIPPSLYGIFFEEISHAGEGGLYGEPLQNRGFEDANLPPACSLEGHRLVPPRTPSYWNDRVPVGRADGRRVQWNVGGWGNHQQANQAADSVIGDAVRGSIETGRWYDLKVEVRGRTLRCYLDGALTNELTPRVDTVLAIAGKSAMSIQVKGAKISPEGKAIALTSSNPTDENSFDEPKKIAPVDQPLRGAGANFHHEFPPYSLSVPRFRI